LVRLAVGQRLARDSAPFAPCAVWGKGPLASRSIGTRRSSDVRMGIIDVRMLPKGLQPRRRAHFRSATPFLQPPTRLSLLWLSQKCEPVLPTGLRRRKCLLLQLFLFTLMAWLRVVLLACRFSTILARGLFRPPGLRFRLPSLHGPDAEPVGQPEPVMEAWGFGAPLKEYAQIQGYLGFRLLRRVLPMGDSAAAAERACLPSPAA
jgi:hypothetical protein